MSRYPLHLSSVPEQAGGGDGTPNVADQPQEELPPSAYPHPPIGNYHQSTGETEYLQAPVHLANIGGLDSSTEANQFTLLRPPHNSDGRVRLIYDQPAESNRIDIDKREIASEFHNQLKSFAGYLKECKERCEWPDNPPEHMQLLQSYIDQGDSVRTSVQEFIKASDGAMQAVDSHRDGTPTQEVWNAFMRNFLRDDNQLQTTQVLMRYMDQWVCYYEADCTLERKIFTFLGQDLGVYGLRHDLLNCANIVDGHRSNTTKPVRDFTRNLWQVSEELRLIREHEPLFENGEISRRWPAPRDTFNWFIEKAKEIYDMIRDLVTVCEAGIPAPYRLENGSVAYGAALSFMGALLRDGRLLRHLENLTQDMVDWLLLFDRDCAPLLMGIGDEEQEIIEDR